MYEDPTQDRTWTLFHHTLNHSNYLIELIVDPVFSVPLFSNVIYFGLLEG